MVPSRSPSPSRIGQYLSCVPARTRSKTLSAASPQDAQKAGPLVVGHQSPAARRRLGGISLVTVLSLIGGFMYGVQGANASPSTAPAGISASHGAAAVGKPHRKTHPRIPVPKRAAGGVVRPENPPSGSNNNVLPPAKTEKQECP